MSASMAETLRAAAREGHSFGVFAIPRLAGKSTTLHAMLNERTSGAPVRIVTGEAAEQDALRKSREGGYLVIPEILSGSGSNAPSEYIFGEPVRRVFATLDSGYSLAFTTHADGLSEMFDIVARKNQVPDEQCSRIRLSVYIRSIGDWEHPEKRRVSEVHEVLRVVKGVPEVRLLHRWNEATDTFEDVDRPKIIGRGVAERG
ncbi:MAG: hypothetical protein NVS1B1_01960 [Candidatus Limnocylindrales bacterium]